MKVFDGNVVDHQKGVIKEDLSNNPELGGALDNRKNTAAIENAINAVLDAAEVPIVKRVTCANEMLESIARAKGETTKSTAQSEKPKRKIPPPPEGFESWPSGNYDEAPEKGRTAGIVAYLDRVWKPYIDARVVDRVVLADVDASAALAVKNYVARYGQLPKKVRIPTKNRPQQERPKANRHKTPPQYLYSSN